MARDTEPDDDLDIQPLDLGIDGNGKTSANEDDQNSVTREISSTRKELFASASGKALAKSSKADKAWRPIVTRDTPVEAAAASKGATFAAETVFHERSSTPTDVNTTTPGKNDCVVRMRFKLQPYDVQEILISLIAHCLSVLQE